MSRMITASGLEKEYGVSASFVSSAIKRLQIEYQVVNGLISVALQDAEPVIFDYYVRQDSYTWQDVAKKMNASPANLNLRKLLDSILPHYCLASGTYYPVNDVEDVLAHLEQYYISKYKDKYYYLEGGREDFYITNYFTISEFRQAFEQKYGIRLKLSNLSKIESQLGKPYPVEAVNLFGFSEYMIPWEYMEPLIEDYYYFYTVKAEENPYEKYEKETTAQAATTSKSRLGKLKKTLELFDEFAEQQLSKTKNQTQKAKTLAALRRYLIEKLDKEINLYKNAEIHDLMKNADLGQRENAELCLFLKSVLQECGDSCAFDVVLSPKREARAKSDQDFYTQEQWKGYINFIFDIDRHIEKAFVDQLYARYWMYCLLQCSLAWRVEDILSIPALRMNDIGQYTLEWFEQNEFTSAMAWNIINSAKKFIEQDRVNKTGAKKHFIILNSFVVATAIGFLICEKHRRDAGEERLFGNFRLNYRVMEKQLGPEIKGFSNLKATRTILSFANETASHMEYSAQAVSIASYMRSHIAGKNGFSDMTTAYLKSSFDERELLSMPAKMGELGLFGWLYHEILTAVGGNFTKNEEALIGAVRENISPARLEGYSGYLLQEQRKRAEIVAEVMGCGKEDIKKLLAGLENGRNQGKKEDIYCTKPSCQYPTALECELCGYSVPSVHALYVIGQEASELLDKLIGGQGTATDRERYSYQLIKLLEILKEAKEQFCEELVSSFVDYKVIGEKLERLQIIKKQEKLRKAEKGAAEWV